MIGAEALDRDRTIRFFYVKQDLSAGDAINVYIEPKCQACHRFLAERWTTVVMPETGLLVALGFWQSVAIVILPGWFVFAWQRIALRNVIDKTMNSIGLFIVQMGIIYKTIGVIERSKLERLT